MCNGDGPLFRPYLVIFQVLFEWFCEARSLLFLLVSLSHTFALSSFQPSDISSSRQCQCNTLNSSHLEVRGIRRTSHKTQPHTHTHKAYFFKFIMTASHTSNWLLLIGIHCCGFLPVGLALWSIERYCYRLSWLNGCSIEPPVRNKASVRMSVTGTYRTKS